MIIDVDTKRIKVKSPELKRNEAGELVYDLAGTKKEKLFGLLSVELARQIEVSAQTGDVVKIDQTFVSRLLDRKVT